MEYVVYLKQEAFKGILDYDSGHLEVEFIEGEGSEAVVFGDPQFVKKLLSNVPSKDRVDVFMDGTFLSTLNLPNVQQLLIIHICRYNHVRIFHPY